MTKRGQSHKIFPLPQRSKPAQPSGPQPPILVSPVLHSDVAAQVNSAADEGRTKGGVISTLGRRIIRQISSSSLGVEPQITPPPSPFIPMSQQGDQILATYGARHTSSFKTPGSRASQLTSPPSHASLRSNTDTEQSFGALSRSSSFSTTSPNSPAPSHQSYPPVAPEIIPTQEQGRDQGAPAADDKPSQATQKAVKEPDPYSSQPRYRSGAKLRHDKGEEDIPSSGMLWYRAPVHGALPGRNMRSHTATAIYNKIWVVGGCDERRSYRDIYCLDTGIFCSISLTSQAHSNYYPRDTTMVPPRL